MKIRAKYCPNCGSTNIKWINPQMWSHWRCYDCGYQGAIILEDEEIAEEVKKEYLRKCSEEEE